MTGIDLRPNGSPRPLFRSSLLPSLATLFRIGFAIALLLTLEGVCERLSWRTPGLPFGVNYDAATGRFFVNDFAHVFGLSKAAARGTIASPYGTEGQLQFMAQWLGHPTDLAFVYGYSPTLWLILAPLFPLSTPLAYAIWTLAPALCLFWVGWRLVDGGWSERDPFALVLMLVALLSGCFESGVRMGQTAVVLGLIAFFLISSAGRRDEGILAGLLLFLSTAKPPLAMALGMGLLWNRQGKPVALAVALAALEAALVTSWLGWHWVVDYADVLIHFNSESAPVPFRPFLAPTGMSNLRHLLVAEWGWSDRAACAASFASWMATAAWGTWLAGRDRLPAGPLRPAFALLLYLLFCPHLTLSNDVLIVIVVWFLHAEAKLGPFTRPAAVVALVVVVNVGPFKTLAWNDAGANAAFLAKVGLFALFLAAATRPPPFVEPPLAPR